MRRRNPIIALVSFMGGIFVFILIHFSSSIPSFFRTFGAVVSALAGALSWWNGWALIAMAWLYIGLMIYEWMANVVGGLREGGVVLNPRGDSRIVKIIWMAIWPLLYILVLAGEILRERSGRDEW